MFKINESKMKDKRIKEIENRLTILDALSVRPLRAISAGSTDQYDYDKLAELDAESELLRTELRGLLV